MYIYIAKQQCKCHCVFNDVFLHDDKYIIETTLLHSCTSHCTPCLISTAIFTKKLAVVFSVPFQFFNFIEMAFKSKPFAVVLFEKEKKYAVVPSV